ncbi:hypothetical protein ALC60_14115 [Trachymyrmex zeteki]|uniref:Uncharacterized protein n=1 Tax=Mycetomoellerius zeteki TaxID=64791 RepID=A0A151WG97_9HYME|nr:hypothetical protein ALC60_14115 [Trachymyrmex zeteki]
MIETAIKQLRSIQRDFIAIQEATKVFIEWAKSELYSRNIDADIQEQFFEMRRRSVKIFFDEKASDEQRQLQKKNFKYLRSIYEQKIFEKYGYMQGSSN